MTGVYGKLKRGSAMLLSILMLVSMLPVSALADTLEPTAAPELATMPEPSLPPVDAALKLDKPFEGVLKKDVPQITFRLKVSRKMDLQLTFAGAVTVSMVHEQDETTRAYSGVQAEDGSWSELTKVFKSKQGSWFITVTALEEAFVEDQPIAFSLIFTEAPEVPGESEPTPGEPEVPGEPEPTPGEPEVPGEPEPTPGEPEVPGEPEPTPGEPEVPGEPEPTPGEPEVPGEPEPTPGEPEPPVVIEYTFADEYDYVQLLNLLTDNGIYASAIDEVTADDPDALEIDYQIGDYMVVPAAFFDTVTVTVLTREGETCTILFHNPGPDEDDPQETDGMVIDPADFMELSGRLPQNAVVDIKPVTVDIEGQRTLAAFDIKIYANDKQKEQGKTWQPTDKKVTVRWQDKAFASRTLDIYHLADGAEPERVASVEAKDGWVEFEADSFSVYAVTETILTQTITTSDGATYEIKVTYTDEAGLPMEGTALQVAEIKLEDEAFASYLNECTKTLGIRAESVDFARAFDIKIVDAKDPDKVLMPQAEVDVAITLVGAALDGYANVSVLHFVNLRKTAPIAQALKNDVDGETVTFATDSFSVYMVAAYTLETLIEASDGNTYRIAVTYDENAGIPLEGVELLAREIAADSDEYAFYRNESVKALGTDVDHLALSRAFNIKIVDAADHGTVYESQNTVDVSITLVGATLTDYANVDVLHFEESDGADDFTVSRMAPSVSDDTVSFATGNFSVYVVAGYTIEKEIESSDGNTYRVTVTFMEDAELPDDADLLVEELTGEAYEEYLGRTAVAMNAAGFDYARIFDISIVDGAGNKVQPTVPVQVSIELLGAESVEEDYSVVHFAPLNTQEGSDEYADMPELLDSETKGNTVIFATSGFSAYAIVQGPDAIVVPDILWVKDLNELSNNLILKEASI